jgi:uncharacterized protein (TIGR03435 family)
MRFPIAVAVLVGCGVALGQTFEVASVRPSASIVGHDGKFTVDPTRYAVRNATLKRLLVEAYGVPYGQITGGPAWIESAEFDIEAKPESRSTPDQMRAMLKALLVERFQLAVHTEKKERRVYELKVAKDGPRLGQPGKGNWPFHGDLNEFARILAIQLTIPLLADPSMPSRASGAPVPVLNQTGIEGTYDFRLDLHSDSTTSDSFTVWQRALQEQLGLRLEPGRGMVDYLVIDRAERIPLEN